MDIVWIVPVAGIAAIAFALFLAWDVLRRDAGTPAMQDIANTIFEGAMAFMRRQYTTIAVLAVVVAIVIGVLIGYFEKSIELGIRTAVAFLVGATASALSGYIGMYISVRSNVRCAAGAQRSLNDAVTIALRGGAVSGFLIVALSLLGVAGIFYAYGGATNPGQAPFLIVGFGFGASFVALFAQLGGGIYTKAADMGADLVGKVEAGIPEDDPRNAAVIADLVGDNVGDCAGRGADLFESTAAENIGAMILGVAVYVATGQVAWIMFPLVVRSFGIFATMVGLLVVRAGEGQNPMSALNVGYGVSVLLAIVGLFVAVNLTLGNMLFFYAGLVGIATSVIVVFITQYYTEGAYRPVKSIVEASKTGPATNIVMGVSVGFESTLSTALLIGGALFMSNWIGSMATLPDGTPIQHAGLFGTAVATMGMLMTAAYVLAMDTFGPITDNAAGIIEMAGIGGHIRDRVDRLDAVGNTTKALTKGYAMSSAGLAAFLLFQAYIDKVNEILHARGVPVAELLKVVDISKVEVFIASLIATMLVFLFSALAMRAVGNTASKIIEEVRRQFRENPGIMAGTVRPDYARAVDITAAAGLREMIAPGVLPVLAPVVVGVGFNLLHNAGFKDINAAQAVAGLLMVGSIAGIILATFMNNGGGAWDNAKKYIEAGDLKDENGNPIGKGTAAHAAAVVGDTVGDPFKDTAGPSLHVLVKLLSTITLVMAPLFV